MAGTSESSSAISDDRFRALVEDLPAVTYIADFVGTFTLRYISPQLEKMFGYSAQSWMDDVSAWVEAVHPDDRDRIVAEAEACVAAALPFDFEYRLITADGRERWIWEKTAVQRDADGQPLAVNGVMVDVTELHHAQDALIDEAEGREREREHYEGVLRRQAAEHRHHALHDDLTGLPNRRSLYERLAAEMVDVAARRGSCAAARRPRPLQGGQRRAGPPERRRPAAPGRGAVRRRGARRRPARPAGRRRVRRAGRRPHGAQAGLEIARRLSGALCQEFVLSGVPVHVEAVDRHRPLPVRRHRRDNAAALRRLGDVRGQGAEHRARAVRRRARPLPARRGSSAWASCARRSTAASSSCTTSRSCALGNGTIPGVEALVRWQHPERGLLAPGRVRPARRADRADQAADELRPAHRPGAGQRVAARAATTSRSR